MEAALLTAFIKKLVARLFVLAEDKYRLCKGFEEDVDFLVNELPMITVAIDAQLSGSGAHDHPLHFHVKEDFRKLAQDMEDCIDRIMYRACQKKETWYRNNPVRRLRSHLLLAEDMRRLRKRLEAAHKRKDTYLLPGPSYPDLPPPSDCSHRHIARQNLVGIDAPLKDLLEHLSEVNQGQQKKRKVISIVGFCGLGKTVLAQELYDSEVAEQLFEIKARVSAKQKSPDAILTEILQQVVEPQPPSLVNSHAGELRIGLANCLNNKRYFIVIDDMQSTSQWNDLESAFPNQQGVGSRIVVTTRFQAVANTCSSTNGYVHKMRRLDKECSKQLLLRESCLQEFLAPSQSDPKAILDKCDGQPLALTAVGQFVKSRNSSEQPEWNGWKSVCKDVRRDLHSNDTLKRMHQVLTHDYTSLPSHEAKACLLYFSMFPNNHLVRRKKLMRQWLAEGIVEPTPICSNPEVKCFVELMDRNIIQCIDAGNYMEVKTYRTYGMMHEYIMCKSISENIICLRDDGELQTKHARRLSLHDNRITDAANLKIDLSVVRSLIVIGQAGKAILDFRKYQLLRVLDLEQCTDLQNDHLEEVCNLLLMKYLSLGGKVTALPKEIKKLKLLETLDLRRTNVKILHPEVIQLPNLIHLFGKFKLANKVVNGKPQEFPSVEQCKLQTLAGFLVDENKGFAELMVHMKKLRKVKIWCESSATSSSLTKVKEAVQEFINDVEDAADDPRSLSIHFEDGCSEDLLQGLGDPCYLRSLKLQGGLLTLPGFVTVLRGLRKLCLHSTRLTADLLTALCGLERLLYLKLIADVLDQTTFGDKALPSLICLCFMVKEPTFPMIEEGGLPYLVSLQLICKNMDGQCGIQINGFTRLREVVLDDEVDTDIKANWVRAAKQHQNRPKVLLLKRADTLEGATESEIIECSALS